MFLKKLLDEHLDTLYINEKINNDLNKIKTQSKKINDSLQSSNVLKIDKTTSFLHSTSPDELSKYAKKKYRIEYINSEKYIIKKIKKSPTSIQNLLIIFHGGITAIKNSNDDEDVQQETENSLKRIDKALDIIKKYSKTDGLTTLGAALAIQHLLLSTIFITGALLVKGKHALISGIIIASLSILVHTFVIAKKSNNKVIN